MCCTTKAARGKTLCHLEESSQSSSAAPLDCCLCKPGLGPPLAEMALGSQIAQVTFRPSHPGDIKLTRLLGKGERRWLQLGDSSTLRLCHSSARFCARNC